MMRLDPSEEDSDDSGNGGRDSPMAEGQMVDLEVVILPPPPLQPPSSPKDNKGGAVMRKFTFHFLAWVLSPEATPLAG